MKVISIRALKNIILKTLKPALSLGLCICVALVLCEYFFPVLKYFSLISTAAAMPGEGIEYACNKYLGTNSSEMQTAQTNQNLKAEYIEKTEQKETQKTEKPKNAGSISEYSITPSKTSSKIIWKDNAAFSNTSNFSNNEILKVLNKEPSLVLKKNEPQILIYHTHSTESYENEDLGYFIKGSSARTLDQNKNMISVGKEIVKKLKEAGFNVIHDQNIYDYPSYNGAYNRSAETVKKYLEKYPSITVTLDIHRDAIEQDSGAVRVKPTATINGKKAAQIMIIAGVDDGSMDFKNWRENMKFASALQVQMEKSYSGLTRAVMVCHRRYNMYLTNNSLLIEIGGHANTLDEALYSGQMLGDSLSQVLREKGKFEG